MRNSGFTLFEVLIALTLSALVVLLAHRIFTGVVDGAARLAEARTALDREMNARRWLAEAFGSLEVGAEGSGFAGRTEQVAFTTVQRTPGGWLEPRRVALERAGDHLIAIGTASGPIVLADGVAAVGFDYPLDPGANAVWVREWLSPVSAPLAIRMRISYVRRVDTLLFLVGPRG